jgi:hypothetical protein
LGDEDLVENRPDGAQLAENGEYALIGENLRS